MITQKNKLTILIIGTNAFIGSTLEVDIAKPFNTNGPRNAACAIIPTTL